MRLCLPKNSEVPVREQLTTQIMLGISSGNLKANQRLPSTRGVYARRLAQDVKLDGKLELDQLI